MVGPLDRLRPALGDALVRDRDIAATYAVDSSYAPTAPEDFTVVRARDVQDVVAVLEEAQAHGIPVVPQGARTSLTGASCATEGAIVLNVEDLRDLSIDPVEGHARVGPGIVTAELKSATHEVGLFYPPDPASADTCTIGGNIATNAGGLCCVKYGVTADYVKALEVVLPGGEQIRTGKRTAKGVAGFDLTGLFVGSEGTLGVVTSAWVRLVPAPDPALTALATFDSLDAAVRGVLALRAERHRPSLLEFLDRASIGAIQTVGDFGFPSGCEAALLVQSDRPGHAGEDVVRYAAALADAGAVETVVADNAAEADLLMKGRRMLNYALEAKGGRLAEDACVRSRGWPSSSGSGKRSASGLAWRSPSPAMVATATCIRRCSSPAATPTVCTGPRWRWRPSYERPWISAARSPASMASGSRSGPTSNGSSAAPNWPANAPSRPCSTRAGS